MEQDEDDLKEWVSAAAAEFTESTDCLPRVLR